MMADMLKFTETPIIDESIEEYEYHKYDPITGTILNNGGDIRISIASQSVFAHPGESYLIFEGRVTKADGTIFEFRRSTSVFFMRTTTKLCMAGSTA